MAAACTQCLVLRFLLRFIVLKQSHQNTRCQRNKSPIVFGFGTRAIQTAAPGRLKSFLTIERKSIIKI
jgi:hypothetical protein